MLLAKDEVLIKEWCYASCKGFSDSIDSTVAITNKRVISATRGGLYVQQQEVPIDCIKGINMMRAKSSIIPAIICFVAAFLLMIIGCVFMATEMFAAGGVFIFIMVILIAIGVAQIVFRKGVFNLVMTTTGKEGIPIVAGATSRNFINRVTNYFMIQVDLTVADDIIETIGALIIENRK